MIKLGIGIVLMSTGFMATAFIWISVLYCYFTQINYPLRPGATAGAIISIALLVFLFIPGALLVFWGYKGKRKFSGLVMTQSDSICPSCESQITQDEKFCKNCGSKKK
ncbi:MAG: hypothetical protein WAX69_02310 [Victivallales bacterium]